MDISTLTDAFMINLMDTSWLEFVAVIFGLLSVWFAKQEKILVYPTGIISVLIYIYICFNVKLFADAGINLFYFIMSVYGWYMWTKKTDKPPLKISFNTKKDWLIAGGVFVFSLIVIISLLKYINGDDVEYWSTNVPYIDTFTTSVFIIAMLLMALKKVESWVFWIVGDIISIPLYTYKGLLFTSFQFLVFLILAVMGYVEWKRKVVNH
jgi:nicotinamide mononucleotide transporter